MQMTSDIPNPDLDVWSYSFDGFILLDMAFSLLSKRSW